MGDAWRVAWRTNPDLQLYGPDSFHPNALGSYLAALVIFDRLTDVELSSLPAVVPMKSGNVPIPDDSVAALRAAAVEANRAFARRGADPAVTTER